VSELLQRDDFGGTAVSDLTQFQVASLGDFTLEVAAMSGQTINIAGGLINYTPNESGTIRFACKDQTVFVFENQTYRGTIELNLNVINYPDIFGTADNASAHTGIYDTRNLFLNPGFETAADGTTPTADNYLPQHWTGSGFAVSGGSRARYQISEIAADREGNCNMMTHQGLDLAQTVALQSHTPYKLKIRRWAHGAANQRGGKWYIGLGSASKQYEIFQSGFDNLDDVANYTKYDHEYTFYAGDVSSYNNIVFSVYPYDKNGSANLPLSHYDRMTLVAGTVVSGITGASSALYLDGNAYAPESENGFEAIINLNDAGVVTYPDLSHATVTVDGKTDLHITGSTPLTETTINLKSGDSWLFFDALKPSLVIEQILRTKSVTINGDSVVLKLGGAADNSRQNARIAPYSTGSVLIPYGNASDADALQVFTQANFEGETKAYPIFTRHTALGTFNNAIRSFKLKRGYMATLANKVDGTGFSKVFIADKADLEIDAMPKGLEGTVSFIRVFRWDWVSQRGWAGGGTDVSLTNSTSFYDWNSGGESTNPDFNYAMIKQKLNWPGDAIFNTKTNVNHLLGYNEPDHGEQHEDDNGGEPLTVEQAIERWPQMMASGLRLGTPAPTNFTWLYDFLTACDKLNYRVDFVAIHSYWYTSMSSWRSQLQAVWNNTKRPIWITEWNNGANWTSHNFPDATGSTYDADGNVTSTTSITLPCSPANAAKQLSDIKGIIGIMEEEGTHIERYFLYNWVQDARAIELGGKLTPAGKWYAANPSKLAFSEAYDHKWKLVASDMTATQTTTDYTRYRLSWKDYNGETAKGYLLEYLPAGTIAWKVAGDTIPSNKLDIAGIQTVSVTDSLPGVTTTYRYRAIGYDNSVVTSSPVTVTVDPVIASPDNLTCKAESSSKIRLTWDAVTNAKSYRIYRAALPDSIYEVVKDLHSTTTYVDLIGLSSNTIYYYKVYSLNNRGESASAIPVRAITQKADGSPGDGITSIESITGEETTTVLPNPVKAGEPLNIRFDAGVSTPKSILVEIFDAEGKCVLSQTADKTVYAPGRSGIYIVKITGAAVKTLKLIVN
jgi:hypothetical protein